jgi:5-methylcytosine-specific restriction enzyme subunit McrC
VRYTVFEQSDCRVGVREDPTAQCFSRETANALLDLGNAMSARVASWLGPEALRFHQYVGMLRVGDAHVEMLPKLEALSQPAQVRRTLLAMLSVTHELDVKASELAEYLQGDEPFIAALARLYCARLLGSVRRGLRQEYVTEEESLACIRGKVDWATYSKRRASQRLEFPCTFDERSEDTALNRTLKAALLRSVPVLEKARDSSVATELRHAMSAVADIRPSPETIARVRTDRMSRELEPLLNLARLILEDRTPDQRVTAHSRSTTYALAWDMNVLFEEYVGRVTARSLKPLGLDVTLQESSCHLAFALLPERPAFLLQPDIVVRARGRVVTVADTKWKRLDAKAAHFGISHADIYQLLAYANRYEVDRAFLIYPHHPALGLPGVKCTFRVGDALNIVVLSLDLAYLEGVGPALMSAMGGLESK